MNFKTTFFPKTLCVGLFVVLIFFQNCSPFNPSKETQTTDTARLQGNGEGYSGATKYYNYSNNCDTGQASSVLEVRDEGTYLTRENCQDIPPKSVANVDLQPHNTNHALYQKKVFEKEELLGTTEAFCRTDKINDYSHVRDRGYREMADVYVQSEGEQLYAYIKVGLYEESQLIETIDSRRIPVVSATQTQTQFENLLIYEAQDEMGEDSFKLQIREEALIGALWADFSSPTGSSESLFIMEMDCLTSF